MGRQVLDDAILRRLEFEQVLPVGLLVHFPPKAAPKGSETFDFSGFYRLTVAIHFPHQKARLVINAALNDVRRVISMENTGATEHD